jgi:diguanylate cyclase (GGDEF)-like protein
VAEQRGHGDIPIAVALADLDRFKAVNDSEGHLVGDSVLRIAARRIRSAVREDDTVIRWGGEEFLVLQSGDRLHAIDQVGEAMRSAVAAASMAVGVDRVLHVTVSVGCALGTVGTIDDTIERADHALYEAKKAGRNAVRTAG